MPCCSASTSAGCGTDSSSRAGPQREPKRAGGASPRLALCPLAGYVAQYANTDQSLSAVSISSYWAQMASVFWPPGVLMVKVWNVKPAGQVV